MEIDKVKWDRVGLTINSSLPVGGPPAIVFCFFCWFVLVAIIRAGGDIRYYAG